MNKDEIEESRLNHELISAVKSGDVELAERLLSEGANIDSLDENGTDLLWLALLTENQDMVRMLRSNAGTVEVELSPEGNLECKLLDRNGNEPKMWKA